jgi:hypothetical protein
MTVQANAEQSRSPWLRSYLVEQSEKHRFLVFHTLFEGRNVLVGLGTGHLDKGEPYLSNVSYATMLRLCEIGSKSLPLNLVEISNPKNLVRKVHKGLRQRGLIFFVCGDLDTYDAVFFQLNLQKVDAAPASVH